MKKVRAGLTLIGMGCRLQICRGSKVPGVRLTLTGGFFAFTFLNHPRPGAARPAWGVCWGVLHAHRFGFRRDKDNEGQKVFLRKVFFCSISILTPDHLQDLELATRGESPAPERRQICAIF